MYAGDYTDSELSLYLFIFKVFSCFVKWYTKGILIGKLAGILKVYVLKVSSRHAKVIFNVK